MGQIYICMCLYTYVAYIYVYISCLTLYTCSHISKGMSCIKILYVCIFGGRLLYPLRTLLEQVARVCSAFGRRPFEILGWWLS